MPIDHHHRANGQIVGKPQETPRPRTGELATIGGHTGVVTQQDPHPRDPSGVPINFPYYDNEFRPSHEDVVIKTS